MCFNECICAKFHVRAFADVLYYLSQQVHPVVMRLCEPFEELDGARLAEALGLNPAGYRNHAGQQRSGFSLDNVSLDCAGDEFQTAEGFSFECAHCSKVCVLRAIVAGQGENIYLSMEKCANCHAELLSSQPALRNRLLRQLHDHMARYQRSPFKCDDLTCAHEEQRPGTLHWPAGQGPACPSCETGVLRKEASPPTLRLNT